MLRFVVFACFLAASQGLWIPNPHPRSIFPNGKIVGGAPVTLDKVPWQVALEDSGYLFCGGSIISANYVLTAAHCTDGSRPADITVRYGTSKLESGGSTVKVSKIAQNPAFNQFELDSDVSVLKLASPIDLSDVAKAVTLRATEAAKGETAEISGWGTLHDGDFDLPKNLQRVSVPVVDRTDCQAAYSDDIQVTERMICAGVAGKDSCQGDSGGAITIGDKQVGVVSWGYGCAIEGYPGVYANTVALRSYIDDNSDNEATWA